MKRKDTFGRFYMLTCKKVFPWKKLYFVFVSFNFLLDIQMHPQHVVVRYVFWWFQMPFTKGVWIGFITNYCPP